VTTVTLYTAPACHLCELARAALDPLRVELGFELRDVDIAGDPALERAYRAWIPVVELDGERVSVYRVEEDALRAALARRPVAGASQTGVSEASL
jgi:glutaredoxin